MGIYIADKFREWEVACNRRFARVRGNEEELNRIFIAAYGMENEVSPERLEKEISIRRANVGREIRSLISYAVGCMFGRYALDREGLCFAGGDWNDDWVAISEGRCQLRSLSGKTKFGAQADNVLVITEGADPGCDIVRRFVEFVGAVYGEDTLAENLRFIAEALGRTGAPEDVLRTYFIQDFYSDHLKIYQKCPIYWMLSSGKKNSFRALIYYHRYTPELLSNILSKYVIPMKTRYEAMQVEQEELHSFIEKLRHLAEERMTFNDNDGIRKNYAKFGDLVVSVK